MTAPYRIAGISGSLRTGSYNTAALRAAREMCQDTLAIDIITLGDIPLYNEDVEARGWPEPVATLRQQIAAVDGVLFAVPEYNYSVPGVLKNAIDWISRPDGEQPSPFNGKPASMIGATPSNIGTARAQAHMRDILFYNAMPLLPHAEVLIMGAPEKFDSKGNLSDTGTRDFLKSAMDAFADWVARHHQSGAESH